MCRLFKFAFLAWLLVSASSARADDLHAEVLPLDYGAELVTIFADVPQGAVPLVCLLRDTLGDNDPENDLLRYVWIMTYTRPALLQRALSFIPFFYHSSKSKERASGPPPPLLDLSKPKEQAWHKILLLALQNLSFDHQGLAFRLIPRAGADNHYNYRNSQIALAVSVLALYRQTVERSGERTLTEAEWRQIQAQLLNQHLLGFLLDDSQLDDLYQKERHKRGVNVARNWELLRQRAEEEQLYFEPLLGSYSAHAVLWVAKEDIQRFHSRKSFNARFLRIKSPWCDKSLLDWKGYAKTIYLDSDNRRVSADHPEATPRELIPLAVYGLDAPHLPLLLIDFRNPDKPKKHEFSKRATKDVLKYLLDISHIADARYFLAKRLFSFIAKRKGLSVTLTLAYRSYSQLKLALLLDDSIDPVFRELMLAALDDARVNPLTNGVEAEIKLAHDQYLKLLQYAMRPDGLREKLRTDREWEMTRLEHGRMSFLFKLGYYSSFGLYRHSEGDSPESRQRYGLARKLNFHSRLLKQVADSTGPLNVCWDMEKVKQSLEVIGHYGEPGDRELAATIEKIYLKSRDPEIRWLSRYCLLTLTGRPKDKPQPVAPVSVSGSE